MNSVSSRAGAGGGFRSGCVRTLGGGRGVGSDGEAEGNSREERRCCTEGGRGGTREEGGRDADAKRKRKCPQKKMI